MDIFQEQALKIIESRSSGSLRNNLTILDSHQESVCTPFTSILKYHNQKFATVHYKQNYFDTDHNTRCGDVEKITFHRDLIKSIRGTTPSRYRNFLENHYVCVTQ
tara:strand:- start:260 stop:574 length:315 start_codon:yes stop_codon:yes gene_type:complete